MGSEMCIRDSSTSRNHQDGSDYQSNIDMATIETGCRTARSNLPQVPNNKETKKKVWTLTAKEGRKFSAMG